MTFMSADKMERILNTLIAQMPMTYEGHSDGYEQAKQHDDRVDMDIEADQQCIQPQHGKNAQVFIEILHRDGVSCAHQDMPAMLQQRIHGDHKKTRKTPDQYQ